jgi:hypothetical protein
MLSSKVWKGLMLEKMLNLATLYNEKRDYNSLKLEFIESVLKIFIPAWLWNFLKNNLKE